MSARVNPAARAPAGRRRRPFWRRAGGLMAAVAVVAVVLATGHVGRYGPLWFAALDCRPFAAVVMLDTRGLAVIVEGYVYGRRGVLASAGFTTEGGGRVEARVHPRRPP